MDKQTLLQNLSQSLASGQISRAEVQSLLGGATGGDVAVSVGGSGLSKILYMVGGIIVVLGIAILVGQYWTDIGSFSRVLVTLGLGLVLYASAIGLSTRSGMEQLSTVFHILAAVLIPFGLGVLIDASGNNASASGWQTLIFLISSIAYLASFLVFRTQTFLFFSILFPTCFIYAFISYLLSGSQVFIFSHLYEYVTLAVGTSYLLLSRSLGLGNYHGITRTLVHVGLLGVLGSTLFLGDWRPNQNIFWELVYPVLVFGTLWLSVRFSDRAYLGWGCIFLMVYIGRITSEYFSQSLGWPLALVCAGFFLIGVGWLAIWLNRRLQK